MPISNRFQVELFDNGHFEWFEVMPHCTFDLHVSNNSLCRMSFNVLFKKILWVQPAVRGSASGCGSGPRRPPRPLCGLGRLGEAHMWEPPGGPHAPTHHLTPQLSSETASRCTHTRGDGLREEPGCTSWAEGIFMQLLSGLSTLRWMVLFYWLLLLLSILCLKVWE